MRENQISADIKFYHTSAGKLTFHTQNDTDKANFRCTANKKNNFFHLKKDKHVIS